MSSKLVCCWQEQRHTIYLKGHGMMQKVERIEIELDERTLDMLRVQAQRSETTLVRYISRLLATATSDVEDRWRYHCNAQPLGTPTQPVRRFDTVYHHGIAVAHGDWQNIVAQMLMQGYDDIDIRAVKEV